ncbi:hypothetical protein FB470_002806 [Amycolatopsis thermophila]|uniref:Uncharacterized protein n=1 Tax=Amycolatopsis thermophila TaxID=206084 RepID=A0ABU0EU31_9PSEU|nr:hypothetical protein [Amycolatopsis thermophila]
MAVRPRKRDPAGRAPGQHVARARRAGGPAAPSGRPAGTGQPLRPAGAGCAGGSQVARADRRRPRCAAVRRPPAAARSPSAPAAGPAWPCDRESATPRVGLHGAARSASASRRRPYGAQRATRRYQTAVATRGRGLRGRIAGCAGGSPPSTVRGRAAASRGPITKRTRGRTGVAHHRATAAEARPPQVELPRQHVARARRAGSAAAPSGRPADAGHASGSPPSAVRRPPLSAGSPRVREGSRSGVAHHRATPAAAGGASARSVSRLSPASPSRGSRRVAAGCRACRS